MSTTIQVDCPNCNCTLSLNLDISLGVEQETIYMTRLEMAKEEAKPKNERQWIVTGYDSDKDRFSVAKGIIYNEN